jgi:hypothetical protein
MLVGAVGTAWWAGVLDANYSPNTQVASAPVQETALPDGVPLKIDKQTTPIAKDTQPSAAAGSDLGSKADGEPSSQTDEGSVTPGEAAAPQKTTTTKPAVVPHARENKPSTNSTPIPETRPKTIEGWTARAVTGRRAVLQGPTGVWNVAVGDTVPGAGRIDSIVRWGNRWIVATSRGLITTD